MARERYTVVYERGEQSGWVASVREVSSCHTHGRSLAQARSRIREALSLFVGNRRAGQAVLEDDIRLPGTTRTELEKISKLESVKQEIEERRREFARHLIEEQAFSYRDVAELIGLSHQRVAQLLAGD